MPYLFTSESVSEGHPDKVSDQISDAILDEYLKKDADSRVAVETLVTSNHVILAGEVRSPMEIKIDHEAVVREVIRSIGYTCTDLDFGADTVKITDLIHGQSENIYEEVDRRESEGKLGAGDQGMMFGFACKEEPESLMPLPLMYAHRLVQKLASIRKHESIMPYLRPDSKSQVTIEYDASGQVPQRIDTIVIATQHDCGIVQEQIEKDVRTHLLPRVIDMNLMDGDTKLIVNRAGPFVTGGPHADAGLTGRKIVVDTYGGRAAHGGGAFSGKDPSKVDRSAAYAARYVAKNLVAAGLADRIEIQIAYVIAHHEPVSIFIDSFGTARHGFCDHDLTRIVRDIFDLTPTGIIQRLDLRRPIYRETAAYGHFGRSHFPWERLDAVEELRSRAGMDGAAA